MVEDKNRIEAITFVLYADNALDLVEGMQYDYALNFNSEQHEAGPLHWAAITSFGVFEIYESTALRPNGTFGVVVNNVFKEITPSALTFFTHLMNDYD